MGDPISLDIARLRRSCAACSLQALCLPAGVDAGDLGQLEAVVVPRRPLARGETLFRAGDPLRAVYVASEGAFKTVVINELELARWLWLNDREAVLAFNGDRARKLKLNLPGVVETRTERRAV